MSGQNTQLAYTGCSIHTQGMQYHLLRALNLIYNDKTGPMIKDCMKHDNHPKYPKRAVVTAGMPYGNKGLHFGHIAGVFVPADFYARFLRDRIGGENVIFVSGTDCYGSPIIASCPQDATAEDLTNYVEKHHISQREALKEYHISLDGFFGSALSPAASIHNAMTQDILQRLFEMGKLEARTTLQFYDMQAHTFLNGRQVIGKCPVRGCKGEKAYADECDMGHSYDPAELIDPVSTLTGSTPELKPIANWYFALDEFYGYLDEVANAYSSQDDVRPLVPKTMCETLVPPRLFIKLEAEQAYRDIASELPSHTYRPAEGNQQSFSLEFENWRERDTAKELLEGHGIRFRAGKCLLPLRITGNISWGVPAAGLPALSDAEDVTAHEQSAHDGVNNNGSQDNLTVWVWPESLWAPISFTKTVLTKQHELKENPDKLSNTQSYITNDWHDFWSSKDARIFQFIGQDNIYFYCIAQPGLFKALSWDLQLCTPVANYHVLFLGSKASSSGTIKPPSAKELLNYYTAEQLRVHWLSLALDAKAVSFAPKALNTTVSYKDKKSGNEVLVKDDPRVADPALKESAFLTNIFNRLARSCFYGAQKLSEQSPRIPQAAPSAAIIELCDEATHAFDCAMHDIKLHEALGIAEEFGRQAHKLWDKAPKDSLEELTYALADAFRALRTLTLLYHGACPAGCERIVKQLNIAPRLFFSWEHAYDGLQELIKLSGEDPREHQLVPLPPRHDFFKKHASQY